MAETTETAESALGVESTITTSNTFNEKPLEVEPVDVTPKPNIKLRGGAAPLGMGPVMIGARKYLMVAEDLQQKGWYTPDAAIFINTFDVFVPYKNLGEK